MSAGSRKKHSSAHKAFGASGNQDHLEVSALLAGAGNGRDVEERLSAGTPQEDQSQAQDALPAEGQPEAPTTEVRRSRLSQAILSPEALDAAIKAPRPELDLEAGGIPGYAPDLEQWVGNHAYRGRNIIAVLVRNVKANLFPELFGEQMKAVIELHAISITGLRTGFTMRANRLTAEESCAQYTVGEKHGRPIDRLMHKWADNYNSCPSSDDRSRMSAAQRQQAITEEDVTIDVMFIEPDLSHTQVACAWLGKNLHPSWYSGIESFRDITAEHGEVQTQFRLSGNYTRGDHVDAQAQDLLNGINVEVANPYARAAFVEQVAKHVSEGNG